MKSTYKDAADALGKAGRDIRNRATGVVAGAKTVLGRGEENTAETDDDILVARVHRPYSYLHPLRAFPKDIEIWDRSGNAVYKVASLPLEERKARTNSS